jgi:hypothetical protein
MKSTYQTGIDTNTIALRVKTGTVGTAFTVVYLTLSGGQKTKIAESDLQSGNIPDKTVGQAMQIKNGYLKIRTTVDFSNVDSSQWANQADKIVIKYTLDGGFSGNESFDNDADDADIVENGKTVVITKIIQLL